MLLLRYIWSVFVSSAYVSCFCGPREIRCIDGTCVSNTKIWNGVKDCKDGLYDEDYTNTSALCFASQMHCATGTCISRTLFGNGVNDCGDNSDEVRFPCRPPLFSCLTTPTECINKTLAMDGHVDCSDASDEVKVLGDRCDYLNECDGLCPCGRFVRHSVCNNGICACAIGYYETWFRNDTVIKKTCKQNKLSDRCMKDTDCSMVMNHTVCSDRYKCTCGSGFIAAGDAMCRELAIGDPCGLTEECALFNNNSRCHAGKCNCVVGYYYNNVTRACVKRRITDPCQELADCKEAIPDSECGDQNNTCQCSSGFYPGTQLDFCTKRRLFESCMLGTDCSDVIEYSDCENGSCACIIGRKPDSLLSSCVQNKVGDFCENDTDCTLYISNSFCINQTCTCLSGFRSGDNNANCVKRRIFDLCSSDSDCFDAVNISFCANKTCRCETGYTEINNNRECRLRNIMDACDVNEDCDTSVNHSECRSKTCYCKFGYQSSDDLNACVLRMIGDETCGVDVDCSAAVPFSECNNNTCVCTSGYLPMTNNTSCVRRNITSPCDEPSDCSNAVENSTCLNSTCMCISGFKIVDNNTACASRIVRDFCDVNLDCSDSVAHSNCTLNTCLCDSGYRDDYNGSRCVLRQIGEFCNVTTDCRDAVSNSFCNNHTCTCIQGYKSAVGNTVCALNRIDDVCVEEEDCTIAVNNSECTGNTCKCVVGYQANDAKNACVLRRIFDKTCTYKRDCVMAVANSKCVSHQCLCDSGYYASNQNQTCTKFKIGDDNCKLKYDCVDAVSKSHCQDGTCECDLGYIAVHNDTVCKKRIIGDACTKVADCSAAVSKSTCNQGVCECIVDMDPLPDNTKCVDTPKILSGMCTFDGQCQKLDNRSYCGYTAGITRFKLCLCIDGYWDRDHKECYVPKEIGDYCVFRIWCETRLGNNVLCRKNKCECKAGYLPDPTFTGCVKYPSAVNGFCRRDEHCVHIYRAQCHDNSTCQCNYTLQHSKDGTRCLDRPTTLEPNVTNNVQLGRHCNSRSGRPCHNNDDGRKYTRCAQALGHQSSRCQCVPGFASRYNATRFKCEEIQTYYFNINITSELGCEKISTSDPLCYIYQPIRVLTEYNNPNVKYYTNIRDRIIINGLAVLFNDTVPRVRNRYVTSEIVNITEVAPKMQIGVLIHLSADYFNIVNETEIVNETIHSLIRSHGEIGKSQLKIAWPFEEEIEYKDFDECTEEGGKYHDCSPVGWCLNTPVDYMCSCKTGYDDDSLDTYYRPGRICRIPMDVTTHSLSCSNGTCETKWEYISLALVAFGIILLSFIGYEIYARKKKLEKSDIYFKLQKQAKREKMRATRERRKTIKKKKEENKKAKEDDKKLLLVETV